MKEPMKKSNVDELDLKTKEAAKERVRSVRMQSGKGRKEFADSVIFSVEAIKKAEQDGILSKELALRIAYEYDVSLDYLFGFSDEKKSEIEHIGDAFDAVFKVEKDEFFQDLCLNKMYFEAFRVTCSKALLDYLYKKKEIENKLYSAVSDEDKKDAYDELQYLKMQYENDLIKNSGKSKFVLVCEEDFMQCLHTMREDLCGGVKPFKRDFEEELNKLKEK